MARKGDDESDFSPKHRIVGAIIIVSLAVIFLPMILNDEPSQPELGKTGLQLSEISEPDAETKVFRLPAASLAQAKPQVQTEALTADGNRASSTPVQKSKDTTATTSTQRDDSTASGNTVAANRPLKALVREASVAEASSKETSESVGKPASGDTPKGWVVQVGTFSNSANAERLRDKLKKSGFLVNLEDVKLKNGNAVRVRVGPYRQKHVAMKAQSKIQKQVGVKGVVLAYR